MFIIFNIKILSSKIMYFSYKNAKLRQRKDQDLLNFEKFDLQIFVKIFLILEILQLPYVANNIFLFGKKIRTFGCDKKYNLNF